MEVSVLASGSAGNAIYVSDGNTAVLVDAGLSARKLHERFEQIGRRPADLEAILLTHEHSDHIGGASVLSRRYRIPLHCTETVRRHALARWGEFPDTRPFQQGQSFRVGSLEVEPFATPHDSIDPVCFLLRSGPASVGVVTDVGCATNLIRQKLRGAQLIVLEFNHDPDLLKKSSYPWRTKQRILSRVGHLSNETAAALLSDVLHPGLQRVVLAHLSEKNNHPELARMHAEPVLAGRPGVELSVASQHKATPLWELSQEVLQQCALFDVEAAPQFNGAL